MSDTQTGPRMRQILAIPGSLRKGSFNRRLLEAAVHAAPPQMVVHLSDGLGALPLFDADLELATSGGTESVRRLRQEVAAADGLLIATPEYNWSIPGVLKNAIDWLSRGPDDVLRGKPVAIIGASSGRWGTRLAQNALRQTLTATESVVMPAPALYVSDAGRLFDEDGTLVDARTRTALDAVLVHFAQWIEAVAVSPR